MSDRLSRVLSAFAVFAVLPAVAIENGAVRRMIGVEIAARPVSIGVNVQTAFLPLDLRKYAPADFGDDDAAH